MTTSVPICTMISIDSRLFSLVRRWEEEREPQNTIIVIDQVTVVVTYIPSTKIVRVVLATKDVDLAAWGATLQRSIQLVTRELWKSKPREGFVGLIDEELALKFVDRAQFEQRLREMKRPTVKPADGAT